jgi:hypothetical protein
LPVDEIVPMFFSMGLDAAAIRRHLAQGRKLPERRCRSSAGVSVDEARLPLPPGQRLYLFSNRRWTPPLVNRALEEIVP